MSTAEAGAQTSQKSPNDPVPESSKIAFQWQTLLDFVALVGRLFYDDACIVLLDFLAKEQRAFLEADLREKLGWREALIQQKLYALEKHMLVAQDSTTVLRSARSPVYWRINNNIYGAVQFRYQQMVSRLTRLVEDAQRQHEFECSGQGCTAKFTALEAACCVRALDDEHPLCRRCGSQLKPSEFEQTRIQAKEKCARALTQLEPLKDGLLRVANMEIPIFKAYTKDEKKEDLKEAANSEELLSLKVPEISSSPSTTIPVVSSAPLPKNIETTNKHIVPTTTPAQAPSRIIPWFEKASLKSSSNIHPPPAPNAPTPKVASTTTTPTKISFGLKQPALKSPALLVSRQQQQQQQIIAPEPLKITTTTSSSLQPAVSMYDLYYFISTIRPSHNEVSIVVKKLGRSFVISEITEEIEQMMTDEEYTIYYNATEVHL